MGKGPVPDIVEKCRCYDKQAVIFRHTKLAAHHTGKVHRSKGVFKPGVVRSRVDKIGKTKLLDMAEPLEQRRVKERDGGRIYLHIPVDRVLDRFHPRDR